MRNCSRSVVHFGDVSARARDIQYRFVNVELATFKSARERIVFFDRRNTAIGGVCFETVAHVFHCVARARVGLFSACRDGEFIRTVTRKLVTGYRTCFAIVVCDEFEACNRQSLCGFIVYERFGDIILVPYNLDFCRIDCERDFVIGFVDHFIVG